MDVLASLAALGSGGLKDEPAEHAAQPAAVNGKRSAPASTEADAAATLAAVAAVAMGSNGISLCEAPATADTGSSGVADAATLLQLLAQLHEGQTLSVSPLRLGCSSADTAAGPPAAKRPRRAAARGALAVLQAEQGLGSAGDASDLDGRLFSFAVTGTPLAGPPAVVAHPAADFASRRGSREPEAARAAAAAADHRPLSQAEQPGPTAQAVPPGLSLQGGQQQLTQQQQTQQQQTQQQQTQQPNAPPPQQEQEQQREQQPLPLQPAGMVDDEGLAAAVAAAAVQAALARASLPAASDAPPPLPVGSQQPSMGEQPMDTASGSGGSEEQDEDEEGEGAEGAEGEEDEEPTFSDVELLEDFMQGPAAGETGGGASAAAIGLPPDIAAVFGLGLGAAAAAAVPGGSSLGGRGSGGRGTAGRVRAAGPGAPGPRAPGQRKGGMPPLCPGCGAPPLSEEDKRAASKRGRRKKGDESDPRNRKAELTREFLAAHLQRARLSLRDICYYHGHCATTVSRVARNLGMQLPRRGAPAERKASADSSQQVDASDAGALPAGAAVAAPSGAAAGVVPNSAAAAGGAAAQVALLPIVAELPVVRVLEAPAAAADAVKQEALLALEAAAPTAVQLPAVVAAQQRQQLQMLAAAMVAAAAQQQQQKALPQTLPQLLQPQPQQVSVPAEQQQQAPAQPPPLN